MAQKITPGFFLWPALTANRFHREDSQADLWLAAGFVCARLLTIRFWLARDQYTLPYMIAQVPVARHQPPRGSIAVCNDILSGLDARLYASPHRNL